MEWLIAAAALVVGLLAGVVPWVLVGGRRRHAHSAGLADQLARAIDSLDGRLRQLAENHAAQQQAVADRLQAQERFLEKALEARFTEITKRVGDGLEKSQSKTLETVGRLERRLVAIDEAQKRLEDLGTQMVGLQDILSNKQARGAFGEIQLSDLVKDALPPAAYEFQKTLSTGKRVDCLLKLPHPPGPIGVDAKFPLESYHALRVAIDEPARVRAARDFRAAISQHIKDIARKYIVPGETAPSALMFLPSEAVYAELHANFPDVVEVSHRAKVWITSPTTLMATLLTVRAILQDARMHEQAAWIRDEVAKLLEDVGRLGERVGNLRTHFGHAGRDIDQIETSAGKVLSRGRKIENVKIEDDDAPAKPRLVSGAD